MLNSLHHPTEIYNNLICRTIFSNEKNEHDVKLNWRYGNDTMIFISGIISIITQ